MLSGYYSISSGLLTRQREIDTIGNNLVNMQTPGHRAERVITSSFEQELMMRREMGTLEQLGNGIHATSAIVGETVPLFHSGLIDPTGRNMDIAIDGAGFFNILTPTGETNLTRNGNFDVDEAGNLTLPNDGLVLGVDGQPINVGTADFIVSSDGTVFSGEGENVGQIAITAPLDGEPVLRLANGMFAMPAGAETQVPQFELRQGNLERSNVDMNQEMTNLISAQRAFQAASSALRIVDELNQRAANISSVN